MSKDKSGGDVSEKKTVNIKDWGYVEIQHQEEESYSLNIHTEKNVFKLHIKANYLISYLALRLKEILAMKQNNLDDTISLFETGLIREQK